MKRPVNPTVLYAGLAIVGFGSLVGGSILALSSFANGRVTVSRLSPDELTVARLVETSPSWAIDRNFRIDLEDRSDGKSTTIYLSPDEGRPPGSERLIWSKDGTKLLVVGRHFFVKDDLFLDNGDQLYLLYDRPTGKFWVNSMETARYQPLKAEQIQGIAFTEPVTLKDE